MPGENHGFVDKRGDAQQVADPDFWQMSRELPGRHGSLDWLVHGNGAVLRQRKRVAVTRIPRQTPGEAGKEICRFRGKTLLPAPRRSRGKGRPAAFRDQDCEEYLERNAPERSVRFNQFKAGIPGFVVTPDHLGFGLTAGLRVNQTNLLAEGKRGADDGHTAGVAYIDGNGIGPLLLLIVFPFDHELYARDDALVRAHTRPAIFET